MANSKTFIRITNKDIFNRIERLEKNAEERFDILEKHAEQTNGKVFVNESRIKSNNQIIKWTIRSVVIGATCIVGGIISIAFI